MGRVSRREFVRRGAAGAAAAPFVLNAASIGAAAPTAQAVVGQIQAALGVKWNASTVDAFTAGDPATAVTGIVTTSLATIDVMRRALKAGANLIVTSGPTFYSRSDSAVPPAGRGRGAPVTPAPADPVFAAKSAFIAANRLVVWRFSDHWRARTPDPFAQGLLDALGWSRFRTKDDAARVVVPAVRLDALAADVKRKLGTRGGMRIIGRPETRVQTVGVLPGTVSIQTTLTVLPHVDVLIAGEVREWESVEYARDVVHAGGGKGLILIGRSLSEDAGMQYCARWLQTVVNGVPVRWMAAGDPYWRPVA